MILRNEIENPLFKDSGLQISVLNKIVAMLGVNFVDEEDRKTSAVEWVNFVSQYNLTAPEILDAYNKTLRRELRNESGEIIKIFPNLSLISAGEILNAFIQFKKDSKVYENGLNDLKKIMNPEVQETEEQRQERIEATWKKVLTMVEEGRENEINFAFLLWDEFFSSGKLKDVLPTKEELQKMQQDRMRDLIKREKMKPIFFTRKELQELEKMEVLPVHNIVKMKIRDEIVVKYAKTFLK